MSSTAMERRVAPRFAVTCVGELASGTSVSDVTISDMSVTGCGLEINGLVADLPSRTGVLNIMPAGGGAIPVMLPVVLANHRLESGRLRVGLQFVRLSIGQMQGLIQVMDSLIR